VAKVSDELAANTEAIHQAMPFAKKLGLRLGRLSIPEPLDSVEDPTLPQFESAALLTIDVQCDTLDGGVRRLQLPQLPTHLDLRGE
jgi:hypothetical protein